MFRGLTEKEVDENRKKYGSNQIVSAKHNGFFKLLLESLGDPIIKILLVALMVKIVFLFKDSNYQLYQNMVVKQHLEDYKKNQQKY